MTCDDGRLTTTAQKTTRAPRARRSESDDLARHFVYLISCRQGVKIGHARSPYDRLANLQTGAASPLTVAHLWQMPRAEAVMFEARLHTLFSWSYLRGEWFEAGVHAIICAGDAIRAGRAGDAAIISEAVKRTRELNVEREATRQHAFGGGPRVSWQERAARRQWAVLRRAEIDREQIELRIGAYHAGLKPDKHERYWERRGGLVPHLQERLRSPSGLW